MNCHATNCKAEGTIKKTILPGFTVYYCQEHHDLIFTPHRIPKPKTGRDSHLCPSCGSYNSSNNMGWGKFCGKDCYEKWHLNKLKPQVEFRKRIFDSEFDKFFT